MGRYLVTGCAGFIGSRISAQLLDAGHIVIGVDNINDAYDPQLKHWRLTTLQGREGFDFHQIDICDRSDMENAIGEDPFDAVINLAARAGVRQSVRQPDLYYRSNVDGALNLLELAVKRDIPHFVQASTSSLYGASNPRPFREDADISRPLSPYAASKGAAEMLCYSFHNLFELNITVLRYFTVYGPAGRPEMSVFRFVQWISEGRPLRLYGDGHQERDFTYVEDIARGTIAALDVEGFEVINLGSDRPVSILELIKQIEEEVGREAIIEQLPEAPADVRATWADIQKARSLLGWAPSTDLAQGIRETISWYQTERSWASTVDTSD